VRAVAVVMLGAAASGEPVVSSERQRHDSLTSTQLIDDAASDAADRLAATEKLIRELNETWEEKIRKSDEIRRQRYCRPLHCNAAVRSSVIYQANLCVSLCFIVTVTIVGASGPTMPRGLPVTSE